MLNYHTTFQNRHLTKDCEEVQVMLHPNATPVHIEQQFLQWGIKQNIIYHAYYYTTVSRLAFMQPGLRSVFTNQLKTVLRLNENKTLNRAVGLVIHADSLFSNRNLDRLVASHGKLGYHDEELVLEVCKETFASKMYEKWDKLKTSIGWALEAFKPEASLDVAYALESYSYGYLKSLLSELLHEIPFTARVYIENTTKTGKGRSYWGQGYNSFLDKARSYNDVIRPCVDIEHAFAAGWGDFPVTVDGLVSSLHHGDLVHMNTLPKGLGFGSNLDRHSETTIFESQVNASYYLEMDARLKEKGIHYVREVNDPVRYREIEQLQAL